jgi:hypothetical protein
VTASLTTILYSAVLFAGVLLGDGTQRGAALIVALVLLARSVVRRRQQAHLRTAPEPRPGPVTLPASPAPTATPATPG